MQSASHAYHVRQVCLLLQQGLSRDSCVGCQTGTACTALNPHNLGRAAQQQCCCWLQVSTGEVSVIGASRGYTAVSPSPDGRFLLVAWLERPFSFAVPCGRFPKTVQLWTR